MMIDALAWVHVRDGKLLAVRTAGRDAFYLPGGKREPGESDSVALAREVQEELGVTLRPETLSLSTVIVGPAHGQPDGTEVRMACYLAEHDGELTPRREIAELGWFSRATAHRLAPAARTLFSHLDAAGHFG